MYFGSVKFFKVLIYSAVICSVIFAAVFSMIFGIKASAGSAEQNAPENGSLPVSAVAAISDAAANGKVNIPEDASIDEIYGALAQKGISSKDIVGYIAENDGEYLNELIREEAEKLHAEDVENSAPFEDKPK